MLQWIIAVDKNKEMESAVVKIPAISAEKGLLREILKGGTAREVIEEANEADKKRENSRAG